MSRDVERQDKRFTIKRWHVILAIIVAVAGLAGLYVVVRRGSLGRRLHALRAAGYPTSVAEFTERNKLPEGAANAAPIYMRAFAAFVRPAVDANVPYFGKAQWPDQGTPLSEPMAKAISESLAANGNCLTLLHEAAEIEHCRYNWDYSKNVPQLGDLRSCTWLLVLNAISHAYRGDPNAVTASVRDGLRLADSLRTEPALVSYLVRTHCHTVTLSGLERALSLTAFTDRQLAELSDALAATDGSLDLVQAIVGERCFAIEHLRDPEFPSNPRQVGTLIRLSGFRRRTLFRVLDHEAECIEAAKLPEPQRLARFRQIDKELDKLPILQEPVRLVVPKMSQVARLDLLSHVHLSLARTALAIERYRLATGKPPEELDSLVPKYLAQVPLDPFDGQPIRYRRERSGCVLYSVGEDGRDNAGREPSPKDRTAPSDLCFIVRR
jgi:hypothetical protein